MQHQRPRQQWRGGMVKICSASDQCTTCCSRNWYAKLILQPAPMCVCPCMRTQLTAHLPNLLVFLHNQGALCRCRLVGLWVGDRKAPGRV